jgi:hypothetical protein
MFFFSIALKTLSFLNAQTSVCPSVKYRRREDVLGFHGSPSVAQPVCSLCLFSAAGISLQGASEIDASAKVL